MPLRWRKVLIADERYESAGVFDVDGDGVLDIVSGAYWYKGPSFKQRFPVAPCRPEGEYYDDFSTIPMDVDGDGRMDFITGGWWGNTLRWRQNPGKAGETWQEHVIAEVGSVETTRAWDIDGDGHLEIVPNTPQNGLKIFKLIRDSHGKGTGKFEGFDIHSTAQGHGLGCGDIAGNGRMDLILAKGWLECPPNPWKDKWTYHDDFDYGGAFASVPILVVDVNGDGINDLIVGAAHSYGLDWWEHKIDSGRHTWIKHPIDPFNAQYHDLMWADIDGDGKMELVTGKRHRAHCGNDPGESDDYGCYYFKWTGEGFVKQVIDYGPIRQATGLGIHFQLADLRNTGRLDIVAPGKDGLYVFYNEGP
jgi:hypothetical protein